MPGDQKARFFSKKRSMNVKQNLKRRVCGLFFSLNACKRCAILPISKLPKLKSSPSNYSFF